MLILNDTATPSCHNKLVKRKGCLSAKNIKPQPLKFPSQPTDGFPLINVITVVGEAKVGKTTIVRHFRTGEFSPTYRPTVGVERTQIAVEETTPFGPASIFRFLDTSEVILNADMALTLEDRLDSVHASFSRCVLIVYDITNHASFEAAKDWVRLSREMLQLDHTLILVGNKRDQERHRAVHKTAGEVFAMLNDMYFVETSAKNGYNINSLFNFVTRI